MRSTYPTRKNRGRSLALTFVAVALLAIAAIAISLDSPAAPSRENAVTAPSSGDGPVVPAAAATIGEEAAVIADLIRAQHDSANDGVADVGVRTILLRPVIYVTTALDAEDVVGVERLSARLAGTLAAPGGAGEPLGYYVRILSAGGDIVGTLSYTDERWSLGGPPAPTDVAELSSWLSSVYGASGPQRWLGAIRDIREPSSDPEGLIRIETALDPSSASDLADAQTIIDAVNSSGARFAPGVRLVFGDGEFEWTALTDGVDPFGPSAP